MKKFFVYFCMAVASVALLGSCSKDDEVSEKKAEKNIVGTWDCYKIIDDDGDSYPMSSGDYRFVFSKNGTFEEIEDGDVYPGKYSISDNRLTLRYDDGDYWKLTIKEISKSELVLEEDDDWVYYFKKK